jgi:mannose-1-phosphate guanylyltransferase
VDWRWNNSKDGSLDLVDLIRGSGHETLASIPRELPKQFSPLFEPSLFSQTVKRQEVMGEVFVCTSESMRTLTESAQRHDGLNITEAFYEPHGRNTAPAIGLVCQWLVQKGRGQEVMGVFPSDHWIEKRDVFYEVLKLAEQCALQKQIVTMVFSRLTQRRDLAISTVEVNQWPH